MAKIIIVANQKGGVAKTTTAVNLSACLGSEGKRVLLVDFDPQGNASSGLGVSGEHGKTVYDVLVGGADADRCVIRTRWCDVLPSDIRLAAAEQELALLDERELRLRRALEPLRAKYDYIFVDCPPSLGLLTVNALSACDSVLIPMQCEYYALEGVALLMSSIRAVKKRLNPGIEIEGVLLTMYDGRTNLTMQVAEEIKRHFGAKVYRTVIPRNVRLSEAPSHGLPVIAYDRVCRGAESYREAAAELLKRNGGKK